MFSNRLPGNAWMWCTVLGLFLMIIYAANTHRNYDVIAAQEIQLNTRKIEIQLNTRKINITNHANVTTVDLEYFLNTSKDSYQSFSFRSDSKCINYLKEFRNIKVTDYLLEMLSDKCRDAGQTSDTDECRYSFRIIVLTYNRDTSLKRLLTSINEANYGDDKVKIEIWIDRSKDGSYHYPTITEALKFEFKHGDFEVNVRANHMGLYGQWLSSYKPNLRCPEIALIVEDDIQLSPHVWTYLKMVHKKYESEKNISGFSLQGRQIKFADPYISGKVNVPNGDLVYLYPVMGTWGFSPRAENWYHFKEWLHTVNRDAEFYPFIPNHLATAWFKEHIKKGKVDEMWEMWHMYYAWKNNENTLYGFFPNEEGIAQHWAEKGLHYPAGVKQASNPLLRTWTLEYSQLPDKPLRFDVFGNVVKQ